MIPSWEISLDHVLGTAIHLIWYHATQMPAIVFSDEIKETVH